MYSRHPNIAKEFSKKTDFKNLPEKVHIADYFDEKREDIHKYADKDPDAAINALLDLQVEEHGSKKEKKLLGIADSSASTDALFKEDIPKKMKLDANFMADGRSKKKTIISPETAEKYVEKKWNEEKGKFDYIYPDDVERKKRREAKQTLKASEQDEIPKKFQLSNAVGSGGHTRDKTGPHGIGAGPGKGNKICSNETADNENYPAKKLTKMFHCDAKSCDHYKDMPGTTNCILDTISVSDKGECNQYEPVPKTETADGYELEGKRAGDYKGGKKGRSWSWGDHKYRARVGPKGDYRYDYTQNQKVPHTEAVVERKMQKEQKKEQEKSESRAAHEGGMVRLPNSGELQNPGSQASRPSAGFRGRAPSPRMAPQSRARHMQNSAISANDVNVKGMMQGPGLNSQMQGPGNPVNQGQVMAPARQAMKGFMANTMVDQAKSQGNVYNSNALGREDFAKQDSSINPLSPQNLTPEQQNRFGQCHDMAKQMAMKTGGQRYTTAGRNAGFHSITVHPDNTVFDHVLGINGMPLNRYLTLVPYSFAPNP